MRKLKLLLNKFAIIVPKKNMSLDLVIISNEPIKLEIVNACNHRVTNNEIILLASLDCCKRDVFFAGQKNEETPRLSAKI